MTVTLADGEALAIAHHIPDVSTEAGWEANRDLILAALYNRTLAAERLEQKRQSLLADLDRCSRNKNRYRDMASGLSKRIAALSAEVGRLNRHIASTKEGY